MSLVVTLINPEIGWPEVSRWWALVPLSALLVYGFLRALQERFEGLEEKVASARKRRDVKNLLGDALDKGNALRQSHRKDDGGGITLTSHQDVVDWVQRTHDLIEAAFDKAEARHFMNSDGYEPEKPLPWRNVYVDPYRYHRTPRLRRLHELIVRANELEINPDFDPQDWAIS